MTRPDFLQKRWYQERKLLQTAPYV